MIIIVAMIVRAQLTAIPHIDGDCRRACRYSNALLELRPGQYHNTN